MKFLYPILFAAAFTVSAFEFTGKVVGVTDGDTITVLYEGKQQYKVRPQHIDCSETRQPFAAKAKQSPINSTGATPFTAFFAPRA